MHIGDLHGLWLWYALQAVAKRDEVLSAIVEASKDNADSEGLDKAVAAAAALLEGSA